MQQGYRSFKIDKVQNERIPKLINEMNDILCLDNEDDLIQILRFFKWNQ